MRVQSVNNNQSLTLKQNKNCNSQSKPTFGISVGANKLEYVYETKNIRPQIKNIIDLLKATFSDVSADLDIMPNGAIGSFGKDFGNKFSNVVEKFQLDSEMSNSKYVSNIEKSGFLVADKINSVKHVDTYVREIAEKYGVDIDFAPVNNDAECVHKSASIIMEAASSAAEKLNKFKLLQEPLSAKIRVVAKKDEEAVYLDLFNKDKSSQYSILVPSSNQREHFKQFEKSIEDAFVCLRNAKILNSTEY